VLDGVEDRPPLLLRDAVAGARLTRTGLDSKFAIRARHEVGLADLPHEPAEIGECVFEGAAAVSDLCDEYGMHPTPLYRWRRDLFENVPALFERSNGSREGKLEKTVDALREKLARKDEVLSELMEEHVKLENGLGEI